MGRSWIHGFAPHVEALMESWTMSFRDVKQQRRRSLHWCKYGCTPGRELLMPQIARLATESKLQKLTVTSVFYESYLLILLGPFAGVKCTSHLTDRI
jgi:hypothetical protein